MLVGSPIHLSYASHTNIPHTLSSLEQPFIPLGNQPPWPIGTAHAPPTGRARSRRAQGSARRLLSFRPLSGSLLHPRPPWGLVSGPVPATPRLWIRSGFRPAYPCGLTSHWGEMGGTPGLSRPGPFSRGSSRPCLPFKGQADLHPFLRALSLLAVALHGMGAHASGAHAGWDSLLSQHIPRPGD